MATRGEALSRSAFLVLLSLADRARHGLGIMDEVEARTSGEVRLGPGTLYGTLKRLEEEGLISETDDRPDVDDDPRRRYYGVTATGAAALTDEAEHLRALVAIAEGKNILKVR